MKEEADTDEDAREVLVGFHKTELGLEMQIKSGSSKGFVVLESVFLLMVNLNR